MSVKEINHPLVKHKIGLMRARDMSTRSFRRLAAEVGCLLTYEATKDLELEDLHTGRLVWRCGSATYQREEDHRRTYSACRSRYAGWCAGAGA